MESPEQLKETQLPAKKYFFSKLTQSNISEEDYNHAKTVWETFKCKTIQDYHDLYLKCDVLRKVVLVEYKGVAFVLIIIIIIIGCELLP